MHSREKDAYSKRVRQAKAETKKAITNFLNMRNIKHEYVLDFACFKYEGKEYRASGLIDVKKIFNVPL